MKRLLTICLLLILGLQVAPTYAIHRTETPARDAVEIHEAKSQTMTKKAVRQERRLERRQAWIKRMVEGEGENEVIVAALLAFFLGFLGIHRVYLGSKGWLVLAYLFTFGGLFDILPLIDFIRLAAGGIDHYRNNNSFFAAFE